MKHTFIPLAVAALIAFSPHSYAATLGTLTYDTDTDLITDSATGTQYLGWDVLKDLTYAETVAITGVGGGYENFHIASQTEAYAFYHAMGGTGIDTPVPNRYLTTVTSVSNGIFGDNYDSSYDYAFFLSDEAHEVGFVGFRPSYIQLDDDWGSISSSDVYSKTVSPDISTITWLLVSDAQISAVPVPAAAFMFAPALLGFMGFRRKLRA